MNVSSSSHKSCRCNDACLIIERKQLSRIVAGTLLLAVFIFLAGYFWGKHYAFEDIAHRLDQDSFADHVYYSMTTPQDAEQQSEQQTEEQPRTMQENRAEETVQKPAPVEVQPADGKQYQLLLFGGTSAAANALAKRLADKSITVLVKKRTSKGKQGKTVTWYQVVSEMMPTKEAAYTLKEQIQKLEKLTTIELSEVSK